VCVKHSVKKCVRKKSRTMCGNKEKKCVAIKQRLWKTRFVATLFSFFPKINQSYFSVIPF